MFREPQKAAEAPSACVFSGTRAIEPQAPGQTGKGPWGASIARGRLVAEDTRHYYPQGTLASVHLCHLASVLGGTPGRSLF